MCCELGNLLLIKDCLLLSSEIGQELSVNQSGPSREQCKVYILLLEVLVFILKSVSLFQNTLFSSLSTTRIRNQVDLLENVYVYICIYIYNPLPPPVMITDSLPSSSRDEY